MFKRLAILICFLTTMNSGCNSDPGHVAEVEPSVPASGVVTYNGKPLSQHQVVLMPEGGQRPAVGVTDADGKFILGTNEAGDGAPPGVCKVAIGWVGPEVAGELVDQSAIDNPAEMPVPEVQIPARYSNAETSGLTVTVPEGGTDQLNFNLDRK